MNPEWLVQEKQMKEQLIELIPIPSTKVKRVGIQDRVMRILKRIEAKVSNTTLAHINIF